MEELIAAFGELLESELPAADPEAEPEIKKDESETAIVIAAPAPPVVRDPRLLFGWQAPLAPAAPAAEAPAVPAGLADAVEVRLESAPAAAPAEGVEPIGETAFALRATEVEAPRAAEKAPIARPALPQKAAAPAAAPRQEPARNNDRNDSGSSSKDSRQHSSPAPRPEVRSERAPAGAAASEEPARPHAAAPASSSAAATATAPSFAAELDTRTASPAPAASTTPAAPIAEPDPPPVQQTVREISMRVAGEDNQRVEVRVVERAGEVRLAVRSADESLARELRGNLTELSNKLAESGYRAETWQPARTDSAAFSDHQDAARQDESGRQQRHERQPGQQQPQQEDGRRRRPEWLEEFEQWR